MPFFMTVTPPDLTAFTEAGEAVVSSVVTAAPTVLTTVGGIAAGLIVFGLILRLLRRHAK